MEKVWGDICRRLSQTVQKTTYDLWIANLDGKFADGALTITAAMDFDAAYVREHFQTDIAQAASQVLGHEAELRFTVDERRQRPPSGNEETADLHDAPLACEAGESTDSRPRQGFLPLQWAMRPGTVKQWRHNFDDFVSGPCNALALEASRSICAGRASNMLFLYSDPGLGKTHLLQSVGDSLSRDCNLAAPHIEYLPAEEFATFFHQVLGSKNPRAIYDFKARFRGADALLLEDLHKLQPMKACQEELLATMIAVLDKGGRVGFSCSRAPSALERMNEQLLSRLGEGLTVPISQPDLDTRRRIIIRKAEEKRLVLSEEIAGYLAETVNTDIRRIEGCIRLLSIKAGMVSQGLTLGMAREVVGGYMERTRPALPELTRLVGEAYGLSPEAIRSKSRKQDYVAARYLVFYLARKHARLTYQEIGEYFRLAHSSVMKGAKWIEAELSNDTRTGGRLAKTIIMIEVNGKLSPKPR